MTGPFKMKGSPMQRNFGIGSPIQAGDEETESVDYTDETVINIHKPGSKGKEAGIDKTKVTTRTFTSGKQKIIKDHYEKDPRSETGWSRISGSTTSGKESYVTKRRLTGVRGRPKT